MNLSNIQDPVTDKQKKYILDCLTWPNLMASISYEQEEKDRKAREKQNKNFFCGIFAH